MDAVDTTNLMFDGLESLMKYGKSNPDDVEIFLQQWYHPDVLYTPPNELIELIDVYVSYCENEIKITKPGELMEQIALVAFNSLQGADSIKSFRSYSSQLDLTITGSNPRWIALMKHLHLDEAKRTIVIESKNEISKVDVEQFSRFCYLIQNTFEKTSDLGVFFTRSGATGFPKKGSRKQSLSNAQAMQIIFHATTGKFIIVLDHDDILQLKKPGALPRILESKIRGVEEWNGLPVEYTNEWEEVDLPDHLSKYM